MRIKAKQMPIMITVILILLFLLTMLITTVSTAKDISKAMLPQMEQQYEDKVQQIKDELKLLSQDNYSQSTKKAHMQKLMADYTDSTSLTYPTRCMSVITTHDGAQYCYSRNAIILSKLENGIEESFPLYFAEDNTADIPRVLTYPYEPDHSPLVKRDGQWQDWRSETNDVLKFSVYSLGDEHYIAHIQKDWKDISGPQTYYQLQETEIPPGKLVHYDAVVQSDNKFLDRLTFSTCVKSFGSNKFFDNNYTKGWKKTDRMLTLCYEQEDSINQTISSPGIFTTRFFGTNTIADKAELVAGNEYFRFHYVAEFSPFRIALRSTLQPSQLLPNILIFIAAWVILMSLYTRTRTQELSALRDEISRQEQALSFAMDAESNRREMTSAIAHELKTPIAVLSSYAEAASAQIDPDKQQYYLDIISQQAQKMDQMVLELLDLSRLEAGKYKLRRENFDMKELAEDIISPLMPEIEEKRIALTWLVTDPIVNGDRYRMGQIVENFMTNAIRHTPEGGRIILRIGTSTETFSVENQGNSISPDKLKKIWDTFYQGDSSRNGRGTGLGLSICRSIVSLHSGSYKAENTALGVKFSVKLDSKNVPYLATVVHREEIIELNYPIAQEYTTVENVLRSLGLINKRDLPSEIASGTMKIGDEIVTGAKQKLYPGNVLSWQEFKIKIILQNDSKRQAMTMELLRGTKGLASPYRSMDIGGKI